MTKKILFTLCACFLAASLAWASGPNMKEGNWEVTTILKNAELGIGFPPFTSTQCLTAKDIIPNTNQPGDEMCKVKSSKVSGNTVTWELDCNENESGYTGGSGSITYSGTTFKGTMTIKGEVGDLISGDVSGKYIGPCK